MGTEPDCLICRQEQADASLTVFTDESWAAGIIPGFDVPGWIVLRIRRHAVGWHGLNAAELSSFGRSARDLVGAVRGVTRSVATYLMIYGEAHPHFHALITPRTEDVPLNRRTGDILKLREDQANLEAARAMIPKLRAAYAELSRQSAEEGM